MRNILIVVFLVIGLGLCWLVYQKRQVREPVVSGIVEGDQIRVGSRLGGRVAEVFVQEGQQVVLGQPLFRLEPFDLNEQLRQAEAESKAAEAEASRLQTGFRKEEIAQAKAVRDRLASQLEKLKAGPRSYEIEMASQQVKIAEANLELAKSESSRIEELQKKGVSTQTEKDQAVRALKVAEGELELAKQQLALLKEGTRPEEIHEAENALAEADSVWQLRQAGFRPEEIAQAQAKVQASAAKIAAIKLALDELTVKAPSACSVEAIDLRPGALVAPNAPAVSLQDLTRLRLRAYVPEGQLSRVPLNKTLRLRVDAFPGQIFTGLVTFVAAEGEFTPRNIQTPEERSKQVFRITVTLDEKQKNLRPGMLCDLLLGE